mgnify:FL=1
MVIDEFGEAKVSHLGYSIVQQNVGRLKIPMHNVVLMEALKPLYNVAKDPQSFSLAKPTFLLDSAVEATPIAVFADEVKIPFRPW